MNRKLLKLNKKNAKYEGKVKKILNQLFSRENEEADERSKIKNSKYVLRFQIDKKKKNKSARKRSRDRLRNGENKKFYKEGKKGFKGVLQRLKEQKRNEWLQRVGIGKKKE